MPVVEQVEEKPTMGPNIRMELLWATSVEQPAGTVCSEPLKAHCEVLLRDMVAAKTVVGWVGTRYTPVGTRYTPKMCCSAFRLRPPDWHFRVFADLGANAREDTMCLPAFIFSV